MAHRHEHSSTNEKRLAAALVLAAGYMVAEAVGGWLTNSLALLADAGHMLSDVAALALTLFALWIARRPSGPRFTYGYYRTEILAALVNGGALVAIAVGVLVEAFQRIDAPPEVRGVGMLGIATGGLAVNLVGLWLLHEGKDAALGVRGAWTHVLADALGSVGAIAAAGLILAFDWRWADPVASVAIALLVVWSSFRLLREAVGVLMEGAPGHLDVDQIRDAIRALDHVAEVHDLHVWTITSGVVSLSCHAVKTPGASSAGALSAIRGLLHARFGIDHVTVQVEEEDFVEENGACEPGSAAR
jgi:cobalt-zinc-cadmium efflux system protein